MKKTIVLITAALALLTACNKDGVVLQTEKPVITLSNPTGIYAVKQGEELTITANIKNDDGNPAVWTLDGKSIGNGSGYTTRWDNTGSYTLWISAANDAGQVSKQLLVVVLDAEEFGCFRPARAGHLSHQKQVIEWTPAPGQFINETEIGGMTGEETSAEAARNWAEKRLEKMNFVSLGGFGGYIVVGFDHSIPARNADYDFAVRSNTIDTSAEPGIVWVMQDTNKNGKPDDTWYELRGAATPDQTLRNYAVTYFRPQQAQADIVWEDSQGVRGTISYIPEFHKQDSYYPKWVKEQSYTLSGTKLTAQNTQDPVTGLWSNPPYDWGYVDNFGQDAIDGSTSTGFRITNAIHPDGRPAKLQFVDFIKVQNALNAQSGILGELSTEVCGFEDLSLEKQ